MSEIKLKMVIDGKEAIASLSLTKKEITELSSALQGVENKSGSVAESFSRWGMVTAGLSNFKALASDLANVISIPLKLAADAEQSAVSYEVMLGSAEKASEALAELKKLGAETPFEFPDLDKNARLLLNFGFAQEELIPTLRMLGDVSGGNAEKLSGLTTVFAQVSSAGKLTGQDLMQFINQGFNPLQIIAEKTGKSMGELKEEVSKGAISFEMVKQAFEDVTSEGGRFYGMMEKQSQTFSGIMSTSADNASALETQLGTHLLPVMKTIITETGQFGTIAALSGKYLFSIIPVAGSAGMAISGLTPLFKGLKLSMLFDVNAFKLAMTSASASMVTAGTGTQILAGGFRAAGVAVKGFFTSLGPIGWALLGITALVTAISLLGGETEETTKKLSDNEVQLKAEKNGYDRLATAVANTQLPMKQRKEALAEINQKYPGYLEKVNLETMSQSELTAALNAGNQAYEKRIKIMVIEEQYRDKLKESIQLENTLRNASFKTVEVKEFDAETGEEYIEYVKTYSAEVNAQKRNLANLKAEMEGMLNDINGLGEGPSTIPITPTTDGGTGGKRQGKSEIVGEKELIAIQKFEADKLKLRGATSLELLENEKNNLEKLAQFYEGYVTDDVDLNKTIAAKKLEIERELQKSSIQIANETAKVEAEILKNANEEYGKIAQEQYEIRQAELEESREIERLRLESIDDEYTRKRALADYEYALNVEKYGDLESLKLKHDMKIAEIDKLKEEAITNNAVSTLQTIGAAFGKHTLAYKMMASTQALISTWQMAQEAYKSAATIPLVGFILAPAAAAAAVATGLGNVAKINSTNVETGYAEGGLLPKGRAGFVEGWHNEIIAPEETFIDVLNSSIIPRLTSPGPVVVNTGDTNLSSKIEALFDKIDAWQTKLSVIMDTNDVNKNLKQNDRFIARYGYY